MSLDDFLKRFFGESEQSRHEKEEDDIIKSLCLAACESKHKVLLECYRSSLIGGCQNEMESFWKCVNDHKALLKKKAIAYRKNRIQQAGTEMTEEINDNGG